MVAAAVGFLMLVLAVWTARADRRSGVRLLAWAALGTVMAQGLLGGLTVLFLLPTSVSVAHACIAQAFLCLMIALAYSSSREWILAAPVEADRAGVSAAAALATGVVFAQLVLGALMRHLHAGLAIPDFPLALGRLIPPLEDAGVALHFAHRAMAVVVLVAVGRMLLAARRSSALPLRRHAALAMTLVLLQLTLGALTVLSAKAVLPTTLHVATGAALLGACFLASLRARRLLLPFPTAPEPAAMPRVAAA